MYILYFIHKQEKHLPDRAAGCEEESQEGRGALVAVSLSPWWLMLCDSASTKQHPWGEHTALSCSRGALGWT